MRENWQNASIFLSLNHQIVFLKGYVKLSNHIIHFFKKIKINPIFIEFLDKLYLLTGFKILTTDLFDSLFTVWPWSDPYG